MEDRILTASARPGEGELLLHNTLRRQGEGHYMPLDANLLCSAEPLYFNVYHHLGDQILRLLFREGQGVPEDIRKRARERRGLCNLFIRVDQKENLLRYTEVAIKDLLDDSSIDRDSRYTAAMQLLTSLCQEVFEKPHALNIFRLREHSRRMLEMMRRDPAALGGFLERTHRLYAPHLHSVNVGLYSSAIALKCYGSSTRHRLDELVPAFFLHDIGKSRIAPEILLKKGPLLRVEWEEVQKHPSYGYNILDRENHLSTEAEKVVLQHHERLDGMGYPQALKAERVHPYARIVAVAEAFNALTTQRPYKMELPPFQALKVMKREMYDQFDPAMFRTLVLVMQELAERKKKLESDPAEELA